MAGIRSGRARHGRAGRHLRAGRVPVRSNTTDSEDPCDRVDEVGTGRDRQDPFADHRRRPRIRCWKVGTVRAGARRGSGTVPATVPLRDRAPPGELRRLAGRAHQACRNCRSPGLLERGRGWPFRRRCDVQRHRPGPVRGGPAYPGPGKRSHRCHVRGDAVHRRSVAGRSGRAAAPGPRAHERHRSSHSRCEHHSPVIPPFRCP